MNLYKCKGRIEDLRNDMVSFAEQCKKKADKRQAHADVLIGQVKDLDLEAKEAHAMAAKLTKLIGE